MILDRWPYRGVSGNSVSERRRSLAHRPSADLQLGWPRANWALPIMKCAKCAAPPAPLPRALLRLLPSGAIPDPYFRYPQNCHKRVISRCHDRIHPRHGAGRPVGPVPPRGCRGARQRAGGRRLQGCSDWAVAIPCRLPARPRGSGNVFPANPIDDLAQQIDSTRDSRSEGADFGAETKNLPAVRELATPSRRFG